MSHYVIELVLWMLLAFFVGCVIGWLLRYLFGRDDVTVSRAAETMPLAQGAAETMKPEDSIVASETDDAETAAVIEHPIPVVGGLRRMERPKGLDAAREGKPDDLQRISGIGPKNEKILHTLGFFHFDQIATWTSEQVEWVDDHLKFNGRIGREEWIAQAKLLAEGKEDEFHALYGTGGKKNDEGKTEAGERTRRT